MAQRAGDFTLHSGAPFDPNTIGASVFPRIPAMLWSKLLWQELQVAPEHPGIALKQKEKH